MNPGQALDNTPKDGDFVRYVDALMRDSARLTGGTPDAGAHRDSTAAQWLSDRLSGRVADGSTISRTPGLTHSASSAASHAASSVASHVTRAADSHFGASAPPSAAPPNSTYNIARGLPAPSPAQASAQVGTMPPDLADLIRPLMGKLSSILATIAGVWIVLGLFLGIAFFADSLFVAFVMLFIAVFLHNQKKRPRPTI